jgi:hypothetical protein
VLWTHNDGGGKRQDLYAISRAGQTVSDFGVTGAWLDDWEDIAIDDRGHLFLGDIGDNDLSRQTIGVHQIDEPDLSANPSSIVRVIKSWSLRYPKGRFNSEALVIWNESGYVITKVFDDAHAELYRFSLINSAKTQTLQLVGELQIDSPVTGADISADGNLLAVVAKAGAYAYRIDGDISRAVGVRPYRVKFQNAHIESCAFVLQGLLATSELKAVYLFTDEAFRTGPPPTEKTKD